MANKKLRLRGRLHGRVNSSRLSELTRFAMLTRFVYLFHTILTLRLHGKRVVPLSRDPACGLPRNSLRRDENCHVITFCQVGLAKRSKKSDSHMHYYVCLHMLFIMADRNNSTEKKKLQPFSGHENRSLDMRKFLFQSSAGDIPLIIFLHQVSVLPLFTQNDRFFLNEQSEILTSHTIFRKGKVQNMDPRSMDPLSGPGPWTPSMDRVHGPAISQWPHL